MITISNNSARTCAALPAVVVVPTDGALLKTLKGKGKKGGDLSLAAIDHELGGLVSTAVRREEFKGGAKESITIQTHRGEGLQYLVLQGAEDRGSSELERIDYFRKLGNLLTALAKRYKSKTVGLLPGAADLKSSVQYQALAEGAVLGGYSYTGYKSKKQEAVTKLEQIAIIGKRSADKKSFSDGIIAAEATLLARDLVNMPPNDCTPTHLAETARTIAKTHKLKIDVFDRKDLRKMGANSLLSVSHGSDQPPFLIRMVLKPKKKSNKVVALVGKGITFDSGGLSIKPAASMEDMKTDMSGAAAVLGAMEALAQLNPRVEVRAYVPTTENMTGGSATRPGDIVKAMNGKTIEILNTDAEGRLILADALCLAEKDGCDTIVDFATLTGACMVALGGDYAGLFTDDDKLHDALQDAAVQAGERLWRLPLAKEYRRMIESPTADIKNTGGRWGGAITAALFLKEFVTNPKTRWAHLDIAGPASTESDQGYIKKGGVGFAVRTIVNFVRAL